ncbi:hypothetical protein [Pengzhenrongella phosphoraccumulans]|uniref:hypothetical protein n=1 Tax=Pengzhenrongella phosphoraccumulans TaxID=3114394 RepID=UPI003890133F
MCLLLTVVVAAASSTVERSSAILAGPAWLDGWFQFDAGWYYGIATGGYNYVPGQQSSIAFFPTYPMAVRGLGDLLGDYQIAGSLIGVGSGAATVLLFGAWVWRRLPRSSALTAVAVMMVYPFSLYLYGAMYADSLFLLTALGAFVLLERRMYWLAGLVGALATAGRPVGIAVAVGLVVRMLELVAQDRGTSGWRGIVGALPAVRWRQAGVLLSGAGLLAWTVYLWLVFGNPLAFVAVESAPGWDQGVGPRTWFKLTYLGTVINGPYSIALVLTLQALACLAAVLLLRRVGRRFGWGYATYAAVVLLIPILGTKDFMGTGRYVLVAFPVLAAAGEFLATSRRRWLRPVALFTSGVLLVVMTVLYSRGIEVS